MNAAGLALDALREAVRCGPVTVVAVELGVTHGDLAGPAAPLLLLLAKRLQVDVGLRHLRMRVIPVGLLEYALVDVFVRVEKAVDLVIVHSLDG